MERKQEGIIKEGPNKKEEYIQNIDDIPSRNARGVEEKFQDSFPSSVTEKRVRSGKSIISQKIQS